MTPPIRVDRLSKRFRRGVRHDSLRDLLPALFRGRRDGEHEEAEGDFWAVRDVSFEVERGAALGIIGPNGAGKSTMLKLLNRILRPTSGTIAIEGRSAALIEVSAGFHPDLTGRENVFLQGAMFGLRRREVATRFDAIVDFSGIEPFIDTPVKRYSSGMNARLGFSIAAHLEPDVLLVDEVLSVGDMNFQQRCVQRMHAFKRDGTAIVFISHDLGAVGALCDRALFLRSTVQAYGAVNDVITSYSVASVGGSISTGSEIVIERAMLERVDGGDPTSVSPGEPMRLVVDYRVEQGRGGLVLGLVLHRSMDGMVLYDGAFSTQEVGVDFTRAGMHRVVFDLAPHVTRGVYHFATHVWDPATHSIVSRLDPAASLAVHETRTYSGIADLAVRAAATH